MKVVTLLFAAILFCHLAGSHRLSRDVPVGVAPENVEIYQQALKDGFLECSSGKIPYKSINDDFCDCSDGLDEPGSSACPKGEFYCHNNGYRFLAKTIPKWKVDDGICDCCDGSDEAYGHNGKCDNVCDTEYIRFFKKRDERIDLLGDALKSKRRRVVGDKAMVQMREKFTAESEKSMKAFEALRKTIKTRAEAEARKSEITALQFKSAMYISLSKADYGPKQQYASLAGKCFTLELSEMQYRGGTASSDGIPDIFDFEVCPFGLVLGTKVDHDSTNHPHSHEKQGHGDGASEEEPILLGIFSGWHASKPDVVLFSNGTPCWNGPDRSTELQLTCGPNDALKSVIEDGKCTYFAVLETPLACDSEELDALEKEKEIDEEENEMLHDKEEL